jgi:hypothetical protein
MPVPAPGSCNNKIDNIEKMLILRKIGHIKILLKADYYDKIAMRLADQLITTWDYETKEAINDLIRALRRGSGVMTEDEVYMKLARLDERLGTNIAAKMDEAVYVAAEKVYTHSQAEILGQAVTFNLIDEDAIDWIRNNQRYWIGKYYSGKLERYITKLGEVVLKEGYDRNAATKFFRKNLGREFKKSHSYWDGIANHVVTRGREFGRTEAYVKANVTYVKFVAVKDRRTSDICSAMHGRILPVSWMVETRDKLMSAKDPEEVRNIAPWLTPEEILKKVIGKPVEKLAHHLSMPPLHFKCRSRTVVATAAEYISQPQTIELQEAA